MTVQMTRSESSILYGMLAEATSDIILKTDNQGFIVEASPGIEDLGIALPMLIGPHIRDLVHPANASEMDDLHEAALAGRQVRHWTEFLALTADHRERWFEIRMRRLTDDWGQVYGTISIMRSVEERHAYEEQLFVAVMTDPLTGLTNRRAFIEMLGHMVDKQVEGCLALFSLDHLKAINMKYGQAAGDEALVTFAEVLRQNLRSQDIISRSGGDSLAVLLPSDDPETVEPICRRIVEVLGRTRLAGDANGLSIAASVGIARIATSVDDSLKRAEMARFLAKSSGGGRVEVDGRNSPRWTRWTKGG